MDNEAQFAWFNIKKINRSEDEIQSIVSLFENYGVPCDVPNKHLEVAFKAYCNNDIEAELAIICAINDFEEEYLTYFDFMTKDGYGTFYDYIGWGKRYLESLESKIKPVLEKYDLLPHKDQLTFIVSGLVKMYRNANRLEELKKVRKDGFDSTYNEKVDLIEFLVHNQEYLQEITIKASNKESITLSSEEIIESIKYHLIKTYEFGRIQIKTEPLYNNKSKGRPTSEKRGTLKKGCKAICQYLDSINKLMPEEGVKVADNRRKFIAEIFECLELISDEIITPKDYINSLLMD